MKRRGERRREPGNGDDERREDFGCWIEKKRLEWRIKERRWSA